MTSRRVCLVALCSLLILGTFIDSTQSASCCLNYIRHKISCRRLLDYSVQTINKSCDINAIIFHIRGRFLCADPASKATQRGIHCIDERRKKAAQLLGKETKDDAMSA